MKKIGLVGGLGPESTLDYYRLIIQSSRERRSPDYPEIVVYSANLTEGLKLMEAGQPGPLVDWLLHKIEALHRAGAELAAICALNAIAAIKSVVPLESVVRVVKVVGFVACAPGFTAHPAVVNGASNLLLEAFGEAGAHARSAVGVASLPLDSPVEVEVIVEIAD